MKTLNAAYLGALIGGGIIWVLEEYVFSGPAPGILADFVDWLAPVVAALALVWLARFGLGEHERPGHREPPPPPGPDT